ncbi:MAG: AAA family ATPase, partial [Luteimonas sp.]
ATSSQRMILEHYGLDEPPFSITPDPRFVFLSERHRDALAHLMFGIGQGGGGGFVQLTGEVGTGKTTLSRLLLEQLPLLQDKTPTRVALVLNPRLTPAELLETICEELRLDLDGSPDASKRGSIKALVDLLNAYLLDAYAQGLRVVLIIDEAQNLSADALEQVRLLTNLETDTQKLLQIILLGQPELRTMLARPELRQLAQRITARFHLTPLDPAETAQYLRHRFRVAGGQHFPFTPPAVQRIHKHSGGVPRLINVVAERALLAGYARDLESLDAGIVDQAAKEALAPNARSLPKQPLAFAVAALVAMAAIALWSRPQAPAASNASSPARAMPAAVLAKPLAPIAPRALDADAFAERLRSVEGTEVPAWNRLLVLWNANQAIDAAQAAACAPVLAPGLYCVRGVARLDKLAMLGRPALLRLRIDQRDAWALLLGADAVQVRLRLGDTVSDVDRTVLEQWWNGEFTALWRGPEFLAPPITAATNGPAHDWIRARLAGAGAAANSPGPSTNVMQMREAVRRFQRAHGLITDGVVGPETLMALAADQAGPRLARSLQ